MAADDFNESKYTEAAWASIAALSKVADYYQTSAVEAPLLLDVLLNPTKHATGAGGDAGAEAGKRVVEKIWNRANVNSKEIRSELEKFLSKQPRVSDYSQKIMGRSLQKVLETSRQIKDTLGVRDVM